MPGSVEPVPEINCGFYTFVLDSGAEQYVVNSFTGEVATITRNADMVDMGMWCNIEYSDGGWAYLEDVVTAVQQRVDGLAWQREAVKLLPEGRLFVQNTTERTAHWLDNKDFINKKVVKTLAVNDKVKLSFSVFELDRGQLGSGMLTHTGSVVDVSGTCAVCSHTLICLMVLQKQGRRG